MTENTDRCICGDDRVAHTDGEGECEICRWAATEPEPCKKFRKEGETE